MSAARRASAAEALARMQRAAASASPAVRTAEDGPAAVETTADEPSTSTRGTTSTQRLRTTLDLDADRHTALRIYAAQHRARGAEVMRALLDELHTDPRLAETIADRLANHRDELH